MEENEDISIENNSGDRNYFTIIPNYIANHSSANDQALYLQMKRSAGEKGFCFISKKTLMKKLKIGKSSLNKSINYLITSGWIKAVGLKEVKTEGGGQYVMSYLIVDIWKTNSDFYEGCSKRATLSDTRVFQEDAQGGSRIAPRGVQNGREGGSRMDTNKNYTNKNYNTGMSSEKSSKQKQKFNPLGSEILKALESVDPKNKTYYGNKTQRAACDFLLEEYGMERVLKAIKILPQTNQRKLFIRQITSPFELKENWVKLGNALKQDKDDVKNKPNYIL